MTDPRLLLAVLLLLVSSLSYAEAPFDPFDVSGIEARPGAQVPLDLRFTDQLGRQRRLAELFGKRPVLLLPLYYTCPNVCGSQLASLLQMLDGLPYRAGEDYELVAFSFNPDETPADARAEQAKLARRWPALADSPGVHLLTGSAAASSALAEALGFRYAYDEKSGEYAHVTAVAALSRDGRLSRWLYGLGYQPDDLRLALLEAGQGRVGDFTDQLLLLCYHYDPKTGGYSSLVIEALQLGGGATVLLLGGFILFNLRRERGGRRP